jgi:hypothetical protein
MIALSHKNKLKKKKKKTIIALSSYISNERTYG